MHRYLHKYLLAVCVVPLIAGYAMADTDSEADARAAFEQMREASTPGDSKAHKRIEYAVIAAGGEAHARLESAELPLYLIDTELAGEGRVSSSPAFTPEFLTIISMPSGAEAGWHPAPQPTINFVLAGEVEVEVRGERRRYGPGSIILGDDAGSEGHQTRSVGEEDLLMVVAPLKAPPAEAPDG